MTRMSSIQADTSLMKVSYTVLDWLVLSKYYTIFLKPKNRGPQVSLYPIFAVHSGSGSKLPDDVLEIIGRVVIVLLFCLSIIFRKNRPIPKEKAEQPSLGLKLT